MDDFLFPQPGQALNEALTRHAAVWPFVLEGIALGHLAYERERDVSQDFMPGVPGIRRVRNDINDNAWRFVRLLTEPLIEAGNVKAVENLDGGDVLILPDGLHARLKKGDQSGATSNYPTGRMCRMAEIATQVSLFPAATPLDEAIQEGVWFDVVYVAGDAMGEFRYVVLKFAVADSSPLFVIDPPSQDQLHQISPAAYDLAATARKRLVS